jgi:N-acetylmuramoyl-L-alanine amidase
MLSRFFTFAFIFIFLIANFACDAIAKPASLESKSKNLQAPTHKSASHKTEVKKPTSLRLKDYKPKAKTNNKKPIANNKNLVDKKSSTNKQKPSTKIKKPIIVIDPGHGGKDPGAIGKAGTYEKNITLEYSLELKNLLEKSGNYKVVLTRKHDSFVSLNERIQRAQKAKADIFISLHADSTNNPMTRGFSVYTLSNNRAARVANKLIREANSGKEVVGVRMNDKPKDVKLALIDMAQTDTLNTSEDFSSIVARKLGQKVKPLERTRREASLQVLTAADVPSVLIELGYVSNTMEEKLLNRKDHKQKIVNGIKSAIDEYFRK